ncbi:hypothetical protein PSTG_06758 [Puccinia striiformis f. sp. tritici PST-78]|uniref:Uncharacterized protein n=1 Tax=Puccinia striiformis f. sp. tritici PST-78 TaxID=1165861 RepID=A0A0L0VKW1_9BASI|nr:hypothetical protein PSTG_06758 [Puccinia striiformis f. sp. tritici PST-78]
MLRKELNHVLNEPSGALLRPTINKHLPSQQAVLWDIHMLYSAIQKNYKVVLDSPNGFDILGVVIYRLEELASGKSKLEAMPLDFVCLSQRHTDMWHCQQQCLQQRGYGEGFKKQKWDLFKGEGQWVPCFAHVLNLIAKGILRPFGTQKKKQTSMAIRMVHLDRTQAPMIPASK